MRQIKALALAAMLVPAAASATPTTYAFGGAIENAGLFEGRVNPAWQFATGQSFSGTLVYDPDAITFSFDYINNPDFTLTFHRSPVVSMKVSVDLGGGQTYDYDVATGGNAYAAVGAAHGAAYNWTGIDLRLQNYNFDGSAVVPLPASAYVGTYRPHSTFLSLLSFDARPLTNAGADVDLVALFNATPGYYRSFNMRFTDSATPWNGFSERLDGVIGGRLTSFALAPTAVPEPGSWALLIFGFGIVGGIMRRSRAGNKIGAFAA